MYNPAEEMVQVVDENNRETGAVPRRVMREKCLIHRATYVLVFNSNGELFVQKRTPTKDVYPGFYDIAAGGVVLAGESYRESAERELEEELGISGMELTHHFDLFYEDRGRNRVWGSVWSCVYDGEMVLQREEVESGFFAAPDKVLAMAEKEDFTPDGIQVLRKFMQQERK
jgi:8-oxo-dGTP pyrophosphatase MutT (NUDIX family)